MSTALSSSNVQLQQSLLPPIQSNQAQVVIGWSERDLFASVTPTPSSLFGPRGVLLHPSGSLWVCDTGHHRLLGWHQFPSKDNIPADIVIGQQDFYREGRNGKGEINLHSLNVPTGITAYKDGLAVADAWNHRVLIWNTLPKRNQQPADLVLGYEKPIDSGPNRKVDAICLYWPYGVTEIDGKLLVADTGNRRILIWNNVSTSQQPADLVLGQDTFFTRDENAGKTISDVGMCWPHSIAIWKNKLLVSDPGNNRIMIWNSFPHESGVPCDEVLGQVDCVHGDHNQGQYYPSASCLNMPYAVAANQKSVWVNDTANSRILIWDDLHNKSATYLLGQVDFNSKGDNQWKLASRASLCWPYDISVSDKKLAVADSGNNRVMIWDLGK